ncbi:MAG: DMT family transporter [Pseudomonadota bacterium]
MSAREFTILIGMCAVWGFHFVVIKLAVAEAPPIFYAALRMTLVAALTAPFLRWRRGEMGRVLVAGACLGGFNYALMFSGVRYAGAAESAVAIELYAPFATILSMIFLKEHVGWRRGTGIAIAFVGVGVIALGGGAQEETSSRLGVALVTMGAFSEAVGAILVKQTKGFRPHELLAWFSLIGSAALWPTTLLVETGQGAAWASADKPLLIGAIFYSALGASVFGHSAYYWLLQRLPVSQVAPSALLTTFFAVICGVVFLREPTGPTFIAGGALTMFGVGVVLIRGASPKRDAVVAEPPQ